MGCQYLRSYLSFFFFCLSAVFPLYYSSATALRVVGRRGPGCSYIELFTTKLGAVLIRFVDAMKSSFSDFETFSFLSLLSCCCFVTSCCPCPCFATPSQHQHHHHHPHQAFAEERGIPFLETSAKNATNVEKAFVTMAGEIKSKTSTLPASADDRKDTIRPGVGESVGAGGASKGCC